MADKQKTGHIVSHTHWDREWRYPIWQTRLLLVEFIDELVELLEGGQYAAFVLDGQVSPVLDYLEIRPAMADRVKALIADDKLQIGPWFTLPDEYPVDGECLLRNLLEGRKRAEQLGKVMNIGYTPFGWGQTAQLPQIYAGFGIDAALIGKRVNKDRAPDSEFIWRGPDGSELLATRFGEMGRQNFYFRVHLQSLYGMDHATLDWKYRFTEDGILYHRADTEQMEQDFFRVDAPKQLYLETITPEIADETWQTTDESVLGNDRLMMNGCDYAAAQPQLPAMIEKLSQVDPDTNRKWEQTTLGKFVELMKEKIDRSRLKVVEGELRDAPVGYLTGNALATRLRLKQLNKKAQNALLRIAEPLSFMATEATDAEYHNALMTKAWDYLLKAHPHDSINGVTQDKTVHDVEYRLNQVIDISQTLSNQAMSKLVEKIDTSSFDKEDILVVVFNPLPSPRRQVTEAWVTIPNDKDLGGTWADDMGFLQMTDAEGNPMATQWMGSEEVSYCVAEVHARILPLYGKRHRLMFDTGEIPAMGYKVFRVGHGKDIRPATVSWSEYQARTGSLLKSPVVMENEYLKVSMNPNGTFNLTDKETGTDYADLNYYEDRGEHGTYWINWRPMHQQTINSLGCAARIWSEEDGPLQTTLVSEITMQIPQKGDKANQRRGDNLMDFTIKTSVTLRAGEKQVEVKVEFDNPCEDHYLRAMLPTGITKATCADSGGHFYVDRRPIRAQGPTDGSVWTDMGTLPMNNFVDVSDGDNGFAVLSDTLTEYEVLEDDRRTLAVSLLRAVKTWIVTGHVGSDFPSQKGGQCLDKHCIRYAVMPHKGDWQTAELADAAEKFNVPAIPIQSNPHEGTLPAEQASFLQLDNPQVRLSCLKKASSGTGYILRLYNPTNEPQTAQVNTAFVIQEAWLTDLSEIRQSEIAPISPETIELEIAACKISTLEIQC